MLIQGDRAKPIVWGIVPARGGSKGVPGKNIKLLGKHPLMYYTVKPAQESGVINRLILSTENEAIAKIGRGLGLEIPFLRPTELAQDTSGMADVVLYTTKRLMKESGTQPDLVFLLQPTSPFRTSKLIQESVQMLWDSTADSLATVSPVPLHLCPHRVMRIQGGYLHHFLPEGRSVIRRQDVEPAYFRNGMAYVVRVESLLKSGDILGEITIPYLMDAGDSISIDTFEDWALAESKLAERT